MIQPRLGKLALVTESTAELADLRSHLTDAGYAITSIGDGRSALAEVRKRDDDLWLVGVPAVDRLSDPLTRALRIAGLVAPMIVLAWTDDVHLRVAALNAGADDVVSRPFVPRELVCRVEAVLRRSKRGPYSDNVLRFSDITINRRNHTVTRNGHSVTVTPREFQLLTYLVLNPYRALSREAMAEGAWGRFVSDQYVEWVICMLRKKLYEVGPPLIFTVRGTGYSLGEVHENSR